LLFLHGGADHERQVLRREHRGYWTSALGLALEKHGVLGLRTCVPDELTSALRPDEPLLVGRLLPETWTDELIDAIVGAGVPVLLEAPLPPALMAQLGVERVGDADPTTRLATIDRTIDQAGRSYGAPPSGQLAPTLTRPVDRLAELDWHHFPEVGVDETLARAWREPGWDIEAWSAGADVDVLAEWRDPSGRTTPAVVRRGHLMAVSYGLFCALGQAHTSEPYDGNEIRTSPRIVGHETLLLALLDALHDAAGATSARVLPWPDGIRWALTIRHDFDRPLSPKAVRWRVGMHDQLGTRATWYWRARHLQPGWSGRTARERLRMTQGRRALRQVTASPNHEIAWHTEQLWAKGEAERAAIEAAAGRQMAGSCAHGGADCFRFQGAPNVLWADSVGLSYTELIQRSHLHPHRFAALRADGRIEPLSVICLPHHESLDTSTKPGTANVDRLTRMQPVFEAIGGLYQLMNHPDLNQFELFELLASFPRQGRLDLTAEEAADWWRRTHTADHLQAEPAGDGAWRLTAERGVQALQVALRRPGGAIVTRVVDLDAGTRATVSA
jgi:hypothetical protein